MRNREGGRVIIVANAAIACVRVLLRLTIAAPSRLLICNCIVIVHHGRYTCAAGAHAACHTAEHEVQLASFEAMEKVRQARVEDPKSLLAVELPLKVIAMVRAHTLASTGNPCL